jgi:hypothetical protein
MQLFLTLSVESKALQPLALGDFGVLIFVTPLDEGPSAPPRRHRCPGELAQASVLLFLQDLVIVFIQGVKLQLQNAPLGLRLDRLLHYNFIEIDCACTKNICNR